MLKLIAKYYLNLVDRVLDFIRGHPPRVQLRSSGTKNALFMYLSQPQTWKSWDPRFSKHENLKQSCHITSILTNQGFTTDVVDMSDTQFVPEKEYDLFIGHGSAASELSITVNALHKACLATGSYGPVAKQKTEERYIRLKGVGRSHVPVKLPSSKITKEYYSGYDSIICFGNNTTASTFSSLALPVHPFPSYPQLSVKPTSRDQASSNHFLFSTSNFYVLKGLDLLLEVFAENQDFHLHICGKVASDFTNAYQDLLDCTTNIHFHGFIRIGGPKWVNICKKCFWYLSPSATEGCQGFALNAMAAGLIPIVSPEIGIDLDEIGHSLGTCTPDEIENVLRTLSQKSNEELRKESEKVILQIQKRYTPLAFTESWKSILLSVQ